MRIPACLTGTCPGEGDSPLPKMRRSWIGRREPPAAGLPLERGALGRGVELIINSDDPGAEDVRALLQRHLEFSRGLTPLEHVHALEIDGLRDPAVTFFSARRQGVVVVVGAIKELSPAHAELTSMHTSQLARRQGVG